MSPKLLDASLEFCVIFLRHLVKTAWKIEGQGMGLSLLTEINISGREMPGPCRARLRVTR